MSDASERHFRIRTGRALGKYSEVGIEVDVEVLGVLLVVPLVVCEWVGPLSHTVNLLANTRARLLICETNRLKGRV